MINTILGISFVYQSGFENYSEITESGLFTFIDESKGLIFIANFNDLFAGNGEMKENAMIVHLFK